MSEANVKTVRDAAAAFNGRDLDAWIEYWTDDIDYRAVEGAPMTMARSTVGTPCAFMRTTGSTRSTTSGKTPSSRLTREATGSSWSSGSADAPRSAGLRRI